MVVWGVIVGAVLGLLVNNPGGTVLGALLGAGAGWWLRLVVRAEVAAVLAAREAASARTRPPPPVPPVAKPSPATEPPEPLAPVAERPAKPWHDLPPRPVTAPEPTPIPAARPAPAARTAPRPPEPGLTERGFDAVRDWLFGGNTIARAGLVVLFIGLAFLARWAAGAGLLPIEVRLALVATAGVALLVVGFSRRKVRPAFALALQGGGVAVLYLTIFASAALYPILPLMAAFALMVAVCAGAVALALLQNSQSLAAAAFAGGYAVPVALGGEGGPVAVMFGYHALINLAVLALAWKKAWRSINLIGFFATFGVAAAWGISAYRPADFAVAETFLILSIAIYLAIAILYARNSEGRTGRFVDSSLLFGVGLVGFGLQAALVEPYEYGAAFSALGFAATYLIIATTVMRRGGSDYRLLAETMLAVGVGFATLAVPLGLGARWTGAAWGIEGAGAFWVGMRQARWLPRAFGLVLQGVAALIFLAMLGDTVHALPLVNPLFMTGMLVALPLFATAWWLRGELPHGGSVAARSYAAAESRLGNPVLLAGFAIWSLALVAEIGRRLPPSETGAAPIAVLQPHAEILLAMLALVASAWVADLVGRRWNWPVATWPGRITLAVLFGGWMALAALPGHHLLHLASGIWVALLALHLNLLHRNDQGAGGADVLQHWSHAGGVWLAVLLLADGLRTGVERAELWNTSWAGVIFLVAGAAILAGVTLWTRLAAGKPAEARGWTLNRHLVAYQVHAALPIAAMLYLGSLAAAVISDGDAAPLAYIPLINPVEMTLALTLAVLVLWRRSGGAAPPGSGADWMARRPTWVALAGLGFVEVNMMWLRSAHHYLGVAWTTEGLLGSTVVQSGITILWTLLALGLMLAAYRRADRPAWVVGATLLVVVVVKLFFVDLSNASGAARIVTFIVVGLLMLVVGYFAPLPPRTTDRSEEPTL